MSYPPYSDPNFISNIESRTEFAQLQKNVSVYDPDFFATASDNKFVARPHQLFFARYVAPETPYIATVVAFGTGTGKTAAVILAALPYIEKYKALYATAVRTLYMYNNERKNTSFTARTTVRFKAAVNIPSIFVIGSSKNIFRQELASHPEFGIVTVAELVELQRLHALNRAAQRDNAVAETTQKNIHSMLTNIKRRMGDKSRGGFWKFIGYQELVNKMFVSLKIDLYNLSNEAERKHETMTTVINRAQERGDLRVNESYISIFIGSFIAFDEIHHTYNSHRPNNWGAACRYLLERAHVERAVFLSATLARALASEFVDLTNLVRAAENKPPLSRAEFFTIQGEGARRSSHFTQNTLTMLNHELHGRVLFYQAGNDDFLNFPTWDYNGVQFPTESSDATLSLEESAGVRVHVSHARVTQSNAYWKTLEKGFSPATPEAAVIRDGAFPLPKNSTHDNALNSQDFVQINNAPSTWKTTTGLGYDMTLGALTGAALGDKRLAEYSGKFFDIRNFVHNLLCKHPGEKIMIFHPRVRGLGVETIANIIATLGVAIMRNVGPKTLIRPVMFGKGGRGDAICSIHGTRCTGLEKNCSQVQAIVVHSYLPAGSLLHILNAWNLFENRQGHVLQIIIASEVLEEMHTLKATRWQLITALPQDIQSLRQLNGRIVRDSSMEQLPQASRNISFVVFACKILPIPSTIILSDKKHYGTDGWDLESWRLAFREYASIRAVEHALFKEAPGVNLLRSSADLAKDRLGPLPFVIKEIVHKKISQNLVQDLPLGSYNALGYAQETAARYADALRLLFAKRGVWTRSRLHAALKQAGETLGTATPLIGGILHVLELQWALSSLMFSPTHTANVVVTPNHAIVAKGDLLMLVPLVHDIPYMDEDVSANILRIVRPEWGELSPTGIVTQRDDSFSYKKMLATVSHIEKGVNVGWFSRTIKSRYNFQIRRDVWLTTVKSIMNSNSPRFAKLVNIAGSFDQYSDIFHYEMIQELLRTQCTKTLNASCTILLATYAAFNFVASAKIVARQNGKVGYFRGNNVVIGSGTSQKWTWTSFPRAAVALEFSTAQEKIREAPIIGVYETGTSYDELYFKLRNGMRKSKNDDKRTFERGVACTSKRKFELQAIITQLSGEKKVHGSSSDLCEQIKRLLLEKELYAISHPPQTIKYFLMFFENIDL